MTTNKALNNVFHSVFEIIRHAYQPADRTVELGTFAVLVKQIDLSVTQFSIIAF